MSASEMLVVVLGIVVWCLVILKFIDAWTCKKHNDFMQAAKTDMLAISKELKQVVETNTEALMQIQKIFDIRITETEAKLEAVLEKGRQLNIMDVRILEMARTIRKLDNIELQLQEAVKNSRRIPYLESILNKVTNN